MNDYKQLHYSKDTKVATILHTSPVTGMSMDVAKISKGNTINCLQTALL